MLPQLEMLIPAVAQTARRWGIRIGRVSLLTHEQRMLTDDVLHTVLRFATSPSGMTLLTREPAAPVHTIVHGSSARHPSIQLADLLAGTAAAVTERHAGNPSRGPRALARYRALRRRTLPAPLRRPGRPSADG
ncbi:hypothetical protein [Streptomyces syringium]|uniref:Uncharacterized protein n=1 Tax=Streptomyces syringium TaxID=76729 RepID=A0ABS4XWE9_9ACTN|nr:hypothetical protein [Streptomyces syringium]MBP2400838.1 hypothetical protein [Streptomyces syringium]